MNKSSPTKLKKEEKKALLPCMSLSTVLVCARACVQYVVFIKKGRKASRK